MNCTSATAIAEQILAGDRDVEVLDFTDEEDYTVTNETAGQGTGVFWYC
ncbi:hypothetical protein [Streptomyces hygroscopicus]|nr:hypothetical protein [Streptomyces hygroscopicus]